MLSVWKNQYLRCGSARDSLTTPESDEVCKAGLTTLEWSDGVVQQKCVTPIIHVATHQDPVILSPHNPGYKNIKRIVVHIDHNTADKAKYVPFPGDFFLSRQQAVKQLPKLNKADTCNRKRQ